MTARCFHRARRADYLRAGDVRGAAGVLGLLVDGDWRRRKRRRHRQRDRLSDGERDAVARPGPASRHICDARAGSMAAGFDAAAYLGRRPTFDNGIAKLEVYLFDFDGITLRSGRSTSN